MFYRNLLLLLSFSILATPVFSSSLDEPIGDLAETKEDWHLCPGGWISSKTAIRPDYDRDEPDNWMYWDIATAKRRWSFRFYLLPLKTTEHDNDREKLKAIEDRLLTARNFPVNTYKAKGLSFYSSKNDYDMIDMLNIPTKDGYKQMPYTQISPETSEGKKIKLWMTNFTSSARGEDNFTKMIDNNGKSFYLMTYSHKAKATCQGSNKDFVRMRVVQKWALVDINHSDVHYGRGRIEGIPYMFAVFDILYKGREYAKVETPSL